MSFLCCGVLTGCQALFFLSNPEAAEPVKAEYGKIGNQRVAVLVWADHSILDEFSRAQLQVCKSVTHHMEKHLSEAKFVAPRKVYDFQKNSGADWQGMRNEEIGRELGADLLLRIDLFEFTTRATDTRELRKARVSATVQLFECGPRAALDAVYNADIKVTYPPESHHGVGGTGETDLLHAAVELFAETTARKFYDHEVKLHRGPNWD